MFSGVIILKISANDNGYKFIEDGGFKNVDPSKFEVAREIDTNFNQVLEDEEFFSYLRAKDIIKDPAKFSVDSNTIIFDFKLYLQNLTLPQINAYHSYDEVLTNLKDLESKYPNLAKVVNIGKTSEGRDVIALKITKDVQNENLNKPGVVITGCHHAREWISAEVPLYLANNMLSAYESDPLMKNRIDKSEVWVIPLVNPDGYEFSRKEYPYWRKNRRPVEKDPCGKPSNAVGTDLNRNYYDGNEGHFYLYRPPSDTPCSTWDDYSATSDNPSRETFRGSVGASEPEIKSLLNLELKRGNIKGIIDYHSYGEMILYPWGHTEEPVGNKSDYLQVGQAMKDSMSKPYKLMQSSSLYPTSGSSEDCQHANNIMSFTIELARSFQPNVSEIDPICKNLYPVNLTFIDKIIEKNSV